MITLPTNWANYGTIMKDFSKKYHITINSENPEGSSQDELNAIKADAGRSDDPDVLDVGQSFAIEAARHGLSWLRTRCRPGRNIPAGAEGPERRLVRRLRRLRRDRLRHQDRRRSARRRSSRCSSTGKGYKIGINNNPTEASAAFSAVFAAALANGGSLNNIKPGVDYFQKLNKEGNFVATVAGPSTVQSGATNIVIWWDYLQASEIKLAARLRTKTGRS